MVMLVSSLLSRYAAVDYHCKIQFIFQVRFSKPVLPGQTLRTSTWLEGTRVVFQTVVVETEEICLAGGWVEFHKPLSK